jgi:molybdopterin molybdotransferase
MPIALTAGAARHIAGRHEIARPREWVPLQVLAGRILAEPVRARQAQPGTAVAAMDGWALRAAATPGMFHVVGESAAGRPFMRDVGACEAVRISTGAGMPLGADAVIRREDATAFEDVLTASGVAPGRDVRQAGEDYSRSDIVLAGGQRVRAHDVGVIASCGWDGAFCRRQPRVAVISTGDELVAPGQAPDSGRVVDSNRLAIAAAVQAAGGLVEWTRWVPDDTMDLELAISDGTRAAIDLLVTCGGASVGDHDHTRAALRSVGARRVVDGIAMRPGRPTALALLGETRVLVLPGPPAAAVVAFHLLGRALLGCGEWAVAPLAVQYRSARAVDEFIRCRATPNGLMPLAAQGSASMAGLAGADTLAWIRWGRSRVAAGADVQVSALP